MDFRICQTSTVSPAEPGDFPLLVKDLPGFADWRVWATSPCRLDQSSDFFLCIHAWVAIWVAMRPVLV